MAEVREAVAGIILAGGRSARFGENKAMASLGGKPMIARVLEAIRPAVRSVLVVAKDTKPYLFLEGPTVRLVKDRWRPFHPLAGLRTGLEISPCRLSFVCACDMPLIRAPLIEFMAGRAEGWEAVVPRFKGRTQPLCGLYSRECLKVLERRAWERSSSLLDFLGMVRTRFLDEKDMAAADPGGLSFTDLDTREDYRRVRREHGF